MTFADLAAPNAQELASFVAVALLLLGGYVLILKITDHYERKRERQQDREEAQHSREQEREAMGKAIPQPLITSQHPVYVTDEQIERIETTFDKRVAEVKVEMAALRAELRSDIIRGDENLKAETQQRLHSITGKLHNISLEFANSIGESRGELKAKRTP